MLQNQFSRILFVTDNFFYTFYINDLGTFLCILIIYIWNTMNTYKVPEIFLKYNCEKCNYTTKRKSQYDRHLLTSKHLRIHENTEKGSKKFKVYECKICNNEYKFHSGLWKHKKTCNVINNITHDVPSNEIHTFSNDPTSEASTVLRLLKQNEEFKQLMAEQYNIMTEQYNVMTERHNENVALQQKNQELNQQLIAALKDGNGTTINNNNTNNNHFNLNFFLNDTCKDAMNITDFLGNLDVQIEEIEYIGNHGYVTGMTKMIMDRLKGMDITKRPIHCTDIKRETMYIKDNDEWSKDTDELTKLRRILHCIIMSNYRTVPKWKTAHPDCEEADSRDYNFCYNMMRLILGDLEDEQVKLDNKIIKTMAKGLFCK